MIKTLYCTVETRRDSSYFYSYFYFYQDTVRLIYLKFDIICYIRQVNLKLTISSK